MYSYSLGIRLVNNVRASWPNARTTNASRCTDPECDDRDKGHYSITCAMARPGVEGFLSAVLEKIRDLLCGLSDAYACKRAAHVGHHAQPR